MLISFNSMGEMVSYLPIDGSYAAYAERFVDKSFGFSVGWIVFYNYATTVAAEATAVASVINYWNDSINNAVWCTLFLASVLLVVCIYFSLFARDSQLSSSQNIFGVKFFGEGEFYFSIFKVLLITGLLIFTCTFRHLLQRRD